MSDARGHTVVVGVDGSPASKAALRWALWYAELTHSSITALMAWNNPLIYDWQVPGLEDFAHSTAKALNATIREVAGDAPVVEINREVAQGHPAKALLDVASEAPADLLVVGNRGHGGFTGALLGSVSQHCVHHASCPVVVIRAHDS